MSCPQSIYVLFQSQAKQEHWCGLILHLLTSMGALTLALMGTRLMLGPCRQVCISIQMSTPGQDGPEHSVAPKGKLKKMCLVKHPWALSLWYAGEWLLGTTLKCCLHWCLPMFYGQGILSRYFLECPVVFAFCDWEKKQNLSRWLAFALIIITYHSFVFSPLHLFFTLNSLIKVSHNGG